MSKPVPKCDLCDSCGGPETYASQVLLPLGHGKIVAIDHCIHKIVAALNAAGMETLASCCGHGQGVGSILLEDGRVLYIAQQEWEDGVCQHRPPDSLTGVEGS